MPIKTTKETAQPLPIIAPPQVPQTVGGITTISASVAPPVISSQTNSGQGIKAKPNTAPQTINAGTDKYLAQWMGNQQAYEQSMKDYNVSQWPAPAVAPITATVMPATPNKPVVPKAADFTETPPVPAGGLPMVTPPKPVATPMGKEQGTTGIYDSASPDQKAQADSMYNLIDPTASLSPEASKDIKDAIASGDVSKIQAISNAYWIDAKQTASFVSAYRTTRDATLAANRADEVNQRNLDQARQSYSDAITKQKANVEAAANQMAMMQETSGRMQSRNMANGIIQAMDEQKRILDNLHQSKDWAFAEIASNAKYNHDILANNYNDAMSQFDQQVQNKIKNLSDTGMAKTADGLKMAQSAIEQAQLKKLELWAQYAQSLQQAVEITKMQIAQKVADVDQTKLINDWYLHNAQGDVVMWPTGKPLTYNTQKDIKQIVDDGKGGKLAVYADGTTSQITEGQVATPEEIQNYVKAVNQNPALFNALSDSIKPQVLAAIGKSVTAPSETAMMGYAYEVAKNGIGAIKDLPPEQQNKVLEMYANMPVDERNNVKKGERNVTKMTDEQGNEVLVDTDTGSVIYGKSTWGAGWSGVASASNSSLMQMLASGKAGGEKFFGVYASGDPTGENRKNAYEAMAKTGIAADLAKFPSTKITEGMIEAASQKTGIDPLMIATILKLDSSYGTAGKGARNNNPGNVGQFDSLDAKGITVKGYDTLQEGIDAVALNLKKRYDALPEMYKKTYSVDEAASGMAGDSAKSFADSLKAGTVTWPQATLTKSNKYTEVAKQLVDGSVKPTDLKNLWYNESDVKQIEQERQNVVKNDVMTVPEAKPAMAPLFRGYVEEGKMPSAAQLKSFGVTPDQFADMADAGYTKYLDQKAKEVSAENPTFDITFNPSQYSANSATQKEKLNDSLKSIGDFDKRMTRLRELFDQVGTEVLPTASKKEMKTLRQQLILKAKEIENLGVLNWPDMGILETLLPETSDVFSINSNTAKVLETLQNNYRSDASSRAINYGAKLNFNDKENQQITTTSGNTYDINQFK